VATAAILAPAPEHYLDNYLASGKNSVLMHDLRFEVDGEVRGG